MRGERRFPRTAKCGAYFPLTEQTAGLSAVIMLSLIDGFDKAVYLTSLPDFDNKDIKNHYFAYPIEYNGERCFVICRTREDSNISRLYIHEVFPESAIKGETLQTAAGKDQYRRGIALYGSILKEVLDDKGTKNSEKTRLDAEYLDAVNSGDMEKAQRMVRGGRAMVSADEVTEACRIMGRLRQKRPILTETCQNLGRLRHLGRGCLLWGEGGFLWSDGGNLAF